jgi:Protoglobin
LVESALPIPGYAYGDDKIPESPISLAELTDLQISAGISAEDRRYLQMAGEVLADQTKRIVDHWRSGIIAGIPHLARHSRSPGGAALPDYLSKSNRRFEQWILDTCFRPYDQQWLNYQHEIALRHTSTKKNRTDGVESTPYVPLRHIIGFVAVMNETIKPYLSAKDHTADEVNQMHGVWCKSMQLQVALWTRSYSETKQSMREW